MWPLEKIGGKPLRARASFRRRCGFGCSHLVILWSMIWCSSKLEKVAGIAALAREAKGTLVVVLVQVEKLGRPNSAGRLDTDYVGIWGEVWRIFGRFFLLGFWRYLFGIWKDFRRTCWLGIFGRRFWKVIVGVDLDEMLLEVDLIGKCERTVETGKIPV